MQDKKSDKSVVAIALIKDKKGRYLLIQQKSKDFGNLTNAWYPPAGHKEKNESVQSCLVRELKEELNLTIKPIKRICLWPQDIEGETGDWWECQIVNGKIEPNKNEIKSSNYFYPEEMKSLKLWPATRKFFEKYVLKTNE